MILGIMAVIWERLGLGLMLRALVGGKMGSRWMERRRRVVVGVVIGGL